MKNLRNFVKRLVLFKLIQNHAIVDPAQLAKNVVHQEYCNMQACI